MQKLAQTKTEKEKQKALPIPKMVMSLSEKLEHNPTFQWQINLCWAHPIIRKGIHSGSKYWVIWEGRDKELGV